MSNTITEIREKFEEIKDHKPRASKKLNELGGILSSAYAMHPDTANDMWQYIVDLNISDDITFSKFYIAQVFNKLTDRMKPEDATTFLTMNPERVHLMIMYGYDGGTLWRCLDTLLNGYIASDSTENAMICLDYFYDKFGGINSGNKDIINVTRNASKVCVECITSGKNTETANEVFEELGSTDNYEINSYVEIVKAINQIGDSFDFEALFDAATEGKYPVEFFDLLWAARNEYDEDGLRDKWIDYIQNCDDTDIRPYNYIREDSDDYENSKLKFYVDIEKNADELLDYYFDRFNIYDVEKGVIRSWIESGDWDRFTRHVAQVVMNTSESLFMDSLKTISGCPKYSTYSCVQWGYIKQLEAVSAILK